MIKHLLAVSALALATPALAVTYTLDFDPSVACAVACVDGSEILQTYGDQPGVDVVYDGDTTTDGNQPFLYWSNFYSNLQGVAYSATGSITDATLSFIAAPGYEVGLTSLSLGAYFIEQRLGFSITDLGTQKVLLSEPIDSVLGSTASVFDFDFKSTVGLKITFLGEFFVGGVDNIVYSATRLATPPPNPAAVPLPAAGWMLLAGLGGLAAVRRRTARV